MATCARLPKLPALVEQKLTKTGYTRGASLKEIYQNRVTRNNPVLIPWEWWDQCKAPDDRSTYEHGFIVLVEPSWYFTMRDADEQLAAQGVELGVNALLLFRRRAEWDTLRPLDGHLANGKKFAVATSRSDPLGGAYFARIHGTVAQGGGQLIEGFASNRLRGAGIRVYEYASADTIARARLQLEALIWLCGDSREQMVAVGMSEDDIERRRTAQLETADQAGLLDLERLIALRILDEGRQTVCPLCMKHISASEFVQRSSQAPGRETYDITTTEVSLFHIEELRVGKLQHRPYNLGWGHHYCNVVVKDAGILPTVEWMRQVIASQPTSGVVAQDQRSVEEAIDG
jgi:hypothetical protein